MIIFKYLIEPGDKLGIEMPEGAVLLSVEIIDDQPYLYALVDQNSPKVARHFRLIPTGIEIEDRPRDLAHIATFQIKHEGVRPLVFHLFEIIGQ